MAEFRHAHGTITHTPTTTPRRVRANPVGASTDRNEPVDKPGSVASNHSSWTIVADRL